MLRAALLAFCALSRAYSDEFPIVYTNDGEPVVATRIDGQQAWLLLDTGSSTTVFDQKFCAEQRFATKRIAGTTYGIYGKREGIDVLADPPDIDGFGHGCSAITVVDLGMRNTDAKVRIVGIIGLDYLKARNAVLDFKNHRVFIEP